LSGALNNVQDELRKFGKDSGKPTTNVTISSNYSLGDERPTDPAVAVYFTWDGLGVCIPVDRYSSIAANLQAIAHIIGARRVELRHGTLALIRATFTGFAALPPPPAVDWRNLLNFTEGEILPTIEKRYKQMAKAAHETDPNPHNRMVELNRAIDQARRELKQ
jgi:hypothetical protein